MATNILMPALSPTMTEGTLSRWLKKEGDTIKAGDVLAEIETDKATMEVEAVDEGVLGRILVADGTQGVKVNEPIGVLVEEGEAVPDGAAKAAPAPKGASKPAAGAKPETAPEPAAAAESEAAPESEGAPESGTPPEPAVPSFGVPHRNGHDPGERVFISPLARRMARQAGVDLAAIKGSGPNGRIVRADIEAARKGAAQPAPKAAAEPATPAPGRAPAPASTPAAKPTAIAAPHTLVPHTTMRRVIARRLAEAKQTVPHFYVSMDIEIDALLRLRTDLNARSPGDGPGAFRLTLNDLLIKAAAITLRQIPTVNAAWTEDGAALFTDIDISVAVSIPDGLITPIIRRADQKGLAAISAEMKDLGARAKAGKLKPEEFQGGGFSISNMGMYGVHDFAAIINPPQAAILAVAAGQQRPVVKDGQIAVATVMTCTLSVDHRIVDGALGAEWLAAFRRVVEDPLSLML
jgi:pyruvate dehydrogenase E2 component (dihydrolipoamide acetyltransferase)